MYESVLVFHLVGRHICHLYPESRCQPGIYGIFMQSKHQYERHQQSLCDGERCSCNTSINSHLSTGKMAPWLNFLVPSPIRTNVWITRTNINAKWALWLSIFSVLGKKRQGIFRASWLNQTSQLVSTVLNWGALIQRIKWRVTKEDFQCQPWVSKWEHIHVHSHYHTLVPIHVNMNACTSHTYLSPCLSLSHTHTVTQKWPRKHSLWLAHKESEMYGISNSVYAGN